MKLAYIGTYPPRKCGIGTFTQNLIKAVVHNMPDRDIEKNAMVIAMNEDGTEYNYPPEVQFTIRQNHQRDYSQAARHINYSDAGVCVLEHEFGIFGGKDGVYILPLLHRLEVPLVVTFHTVLKEPSYTQRSIVEEIGKLAAKVVVMSHRAVEFLTSIYGIAEEKIALIEHGVPDFAYVSQEDVKKKYNFEDRKVLFTFGLLSRNKGIETVINALPEVVSQHPEVLYIVLGKTHPGVLQHSGEEYRNYLRRLVIKYGLEDNVYFNNEFASEKQIYEYLTASDIYITPYLNEAQITSGTLAYAIGAGSAVVSTPYWHAQELLDEGRGRLFDFQDSSGLAKILNELLGDKTKLQALRKNAYTYGLNLRWPIIGMQYLELANKLEETWEPPKEEQRLLIDPAVLPKYNLYHVMRLTDDTGIVQHAKYGIPNLKEGYCLDDNARALLFMLMAYRRNQDKNAFNMIPIYLSYINYMQNKDGSFRNFMSFSRQFLDENGSEDSFGRAIWALGYLIHFAPNDSFKQIGLDLFHHSIPYFDKLNSLRGRANTIIGMYYYIKETDDEGMVARVRDMAQTIVKEYKAASNGQWKWYENVLTYDNGILPLALFHAAEIAGNEEFLHIAKESTAFLEELTMKNGYLNPVGNQGWMEKGGQMAEYDQQSIDVMAMVLLYFQAFQLTRDKDYLSKLFHTYLWFMGENSMRLPLYDHETHGCCDGLEQQGVNRNQGAESTLAYWISHITVLAAHEKEHDLEN